MIRKVRVIRKKIYTELILKVLYRHCNPRIMMVYIKPFFPFIFYTLIKSWSRHQFEGRSIPNRCCLLVQISDNLKEEIYQIYYVVYLFRSRTSQSLDWNMRKFESISSSSPSSIVLSSFLCYLLVVVVNNACYPCLPEHCCNLFNCTNSQILYMYLCSVMYLAKYVACLWTNKWMIFNKCNEGFNFCLFYVVLCILYWTRFIEQNRTSVI